MKKKKKGSKFRNPNEVIKELASKNRRKWSDLLPEDVTRIILMKVGCWDVMKSAQFVCKSWYNLCQQPSMWRTIRIENWSRSYSWSMECEDVTFDAIDRSDGGLIDLDILGFGSDHLASYLAFRSPQLKRLRIARCNSLSHEALGDALEKLSSLEELEITLCNFRDESIVTLISCLSSSFITTFRFNKYYLKFRPIRWPVNDYQARAIAENMPELRHLQLIANHMTDAGLTAILDGCPHLQYLDLRACYNVKLAGNLETRLNEQIKVFLRPDDPAEDCEYEYGYYNYTDWDSDSFCSFCWSIDWAGEYDDDFFRDDELDEYDFTVV